jgi:hypothetical protein
MEQKMTTSQVKACAFYYSLKDFSDLLLKSEGGKTRTAKPH